MSVIVILIGASLLVALGFLAGFIWAVRAGQYDDTSTPSLRVLAEETSPSPHGGRMDRPRTASPLTPALSPPAGPKPLRRGEGPLRGEGVATNGVDLRTSQPAMVHQEISSHLHSESNRS